MLRTTYRLKPPKCSPGEEKHKNPNKFGRCYFVVGGVGGAGPLFESAFIWLDFIIICRVYIIF